MSDSKALAIIPRTLSEVADLADRFAKSALLSPDLRNKAADVFVTLLAGQELGLSPMASLRSIHVVKGRPILSADAMVGLCLASGLCDYFRPGAKSGTSATYETKRKGCEPVALTYTIEDAKQAGIAGGDNWRKYTRAMLSARCKAELARDVYPDVLAGVYEEGEGAEIRGDANVTPMRSVDAEAADAEIVSEASTTRSFSVDAALSALSAAPDEGALRALGGEMRDDIKRQAAPVRAQLQAAYKARAEILRNPLPVDEPEPGADADEDPAQAAP